MIKKSCGRMWRDFNGWKGRLTLGFKLGCSLDSKYKGRTIRSRLHAHKQTHTWSVSSKKPQQLAGQPWSTP